MSKTESDDAQADREILTTRVFNAPRGLVFRAWTEPERVARWWGPRGFTTTTHAMDVRPGGAWRYVMHGPDGVDYDNKIVYTEVVAPERLAYDQVGDEGRDAVAFRATVTFVERGGRTEVTLRMTFPSAAVREHVAAKYGAVEGATQTFERLAEHLAETARAGASPSEREVVLTRVYDAPRPLVFRAWTDPAHLARWWGPHGFTAPVCEIDARPGGALRIVMRGPNDLSYPMTGIIREIVEPERLSFTFVAMDGANNPLLDGLTTVTLAEHEGKTTLTLRTRAVALVAAAASALAGMEIGWSESLERLADLVAKP